MDQNIKVLIVEDFPPDAELEEITIRQVIPCSEFLRVQTKKDFLLALDKFMPDIIVSDYSMPQFDGMTALKLTKENYPNIPFILCTGSLNEDTAVECMKQGATDYIIKEHSKRLGESVKSALEQAEAQKAKRKAQHIAQQANQDQELLLSTAIQFLQSKTLKDIYKIVFEVVQNLEQDSYIVVSSNNPEENTQKVEHYKGFEKYMSWFEKMFHLNAENLKIPIGNLSQAEIDNYNSGKLLEEPDKLFALSAKTLPREVCSLIEKALRIKEVYYIGFSSQKKQLGIVTFLKKSKSFPEKAELIEIIMGQASQAIQKLMALESSQLNSERLESLLTISQYKPQSVQELLDKALAEIVQLTRSNIGYIYHYIAQNKTFILNTWSKDVMPQCKINESQSIFELDKTGIWGEAVRQRKPIIINQYSAPNPLKKGYPKGHVPLTKFLTIPIFYQDDIVAVAGVGNKKSDYTQSDVNQLTLMMDGVWKLVKQKETDLLLRENEEKYKAVMEQSLDNIYLAEIKTMKVLEANPAFCQFLGYTLAEMKKLRILDFVQTTQEKQNTLIQTLLAKKKLYLGERKYIKKDGSIAFVEATVSMLRYQDNEVFCVISHDVTERKKAELELYESKEKLRIIFDYSPIGTASFNKNGFLYTSNQSFKELFFIPTTIEAVEFNIFQEEMLSQKERDLLIQCEVLNLEKTFTFNVLETIFQCKMNRTGKIDLDLTIKAVEINPETHELEYLMQVQDITERKKLESIKNEFINTVSHEMRTPLTSIRESIIILKTHYQKNLTNDQLSLLEITLRNSNRLGKLIQDVLDFQKLNAVLMDFNLKPENINEISEQIIKDLSSYTATTDLKIIKDLALDLPLVRIDKDRISQVLINLVNNAVKFTKKGSVTLKTETVNGNKLVKVSVIDTGTGIAKENFEKIFTPFFQVVKEKEYQSGGTGLGLSISNKILEGHNSRLFVESEEGKGSIFYFYLPVQDEISCKEES